LRENRLRKYKLDLVVVFIGIVWIYGTSDQEKSSGYLGKIRKTLDW